MRFQDCASISFSINGFLFSMTLAKYFFLKEKKSYTITEQQKKKWFSTAIIFYICIREEITRVQDPELSLAISGLQQIFSDLLLWYPCITQQVFVLFWLFYNLMFSPIVQKSWSGNLRELCVYVYGSVCLIGKLIFNPSFHPPSSPFHWSSLSPSLFYFHVTSAYLILCT